jgi:hypothetical protein
MKHGGNFYGKHHSNYWIDCRQQHYKTLILFLCEGSNRKVYVIPLMKLGSLKVLGLREYGWGLAKSRKKSAAKKLDKWCTGTSSLVLETTLTNKVVYSLNKLLYLQLVL